MQKQLYFLFFFITLCVKTASASSEFREIRFPFVTREHQTVEVTLVMSPALDAQRSVITAKTRRTLRTCETKMGLGLHENIALFFDVDPDQHNGMTTVVPTNRIQIMTEAPDLESSIGLNSDFLTETLVHELSHMTVMQRYGGVFWFFDKIVGNTSRPLGLWPRWLHEGLAVWTEGALGGRPASGYLDFDRRRYADYFRRFKKSPFNNNQMDGGSRLGRVEEGNLPYHFGYDLVEDIFESAQVPLANFLDVSAKNLGLSFRVVLRDSYHVDIDQRFKDLQSRWAMTPLGPAKQNNAEPALAHAATIAGPFYSLIGQGLPIRRSVTWIESDNRQTKTQLMARFEGENLVKPLVWERPFSQPLQAYYAGGGKWFVLSRELVERGQWFVDSAAPLQRKILLYVNGKEQCSVDLRGRIREFHFAEQRLSWIESRPDGSQEIWQAPTDGACRLTEPPRSLAKTNLPFQRFSGLYVDSKNLLFSKTDPAADQITETLYWNQKPVRADMPLGFAVPYDDGLLATAFSKNHWGPVLIKSVNGVPRVAAQLSVATGAYRTVPQVSANGVWVKEAFWENDQLKPYGRKDFAAPIKFSPQVTAKKILATPADEAVVESRYSPWPSIWPHFWIPSMMAVTGGFAVTGQTFYEDLSQRWSGYTLVGYDSFLGKPIFSTALTRAKLSWGPLNSATLIGFYTPVSTYFGRQLVVQDRYGASVSASAGGLVQSFRISESLGATLLQAERSAYFQSYSRLIPSASLRISSSQASDPESAAFRLFDVKNSGSVFGSLRYVKKPEYVTRGQWQFPLLGTGWLLSSEYGRTARDNFPISYFEVGGFPQIATANSLFLSRGFSYRFASVREALRLATEIGISLGKAGSGLGWNRFSFAESQLRLIGETVSFATFNGQRFRVGRQYFSSAGAELDFMGSTLFYINYRISLGGYRGFGPYGETRYALVLRSGLDL